MGFSRQEHCSGSPFPSPMHESEKWKWSRSVVSDPQWPHGQHIKKQRHYFVNRSPSSQGYGFSSSHVWMWDLDYKESWVPKNWWFWTVVLKKTLESALDCKEIQPVHPKGDQSYVFIGRTDAKVETPIFWPPDAKSWLTHWKIPWCWEVLRRGRESRGQ